MRRSPTGVGAILTRWPRRVRSPRPARVVLERIGGPVTLLGDKSGARTAATPKFR